MAHGHSTLSKPSKSIQIAVLFPKLLKSGRHKDTKRLLKELEKGSSVPLIVEGLPLHSSERHRPGEVFFLCVTLFTKCCHLERGRNPSVLCTVPNVSSGPGGPTPWSQTGASCTPLFHPVTWYHESAVLGWSSSCQIFSCSSFSSSFCG